MTTCPFDDQGLFRPFVCGAFSVLKPWDQPDHAHLEAIAHWLIPQTVHAGVQAWICGSYLDPLIEAWDIDIVISKYEPATGQELEKLGNDMLVWQEHIRDQHNLLAHICYIDPKPEAPDATGVDRFWHTLDMFQARGRFHSVMYTPIPVAPDAAYISTSLYKTGSLVPSQKHLDRISKGHGYPNPVLLDSFFANTLRAGVGK